MDKVIREVDVDTLQDQLEMITFCNTTTTDFAQYADPSFIKMFRIAQLTIEYSLYTMEIVDEARLNLEKEHATQKKKADAATIKVAVPKVILTPPCVFHSRFPIQHKHGGVRMTR